jgi:general secretion pathway protein C
MATVAQTLRFDGELGSQLVARLPHALAGLLIVLIGVRAALFLADLAGPPLVEPLGSAPTAQPVRNVVDVPSILRANLFGQSPPAAGSEAPLTSMPLVLSGVVASDDEKLGLAMIGAAANSIEMKRVGDTLPGGATLHAVHVDRVLLERGGAIEALPLPDPSPPTFSAPPPPANTGTPVVSLQRVEQAIRGNPGLIGQVMHRTPVFTDGRLRGIKVSPGPNAAAFARLGLRNGDLVTAINGVQLNDEARSRDVFDSLSGAAEARVMVDRNGTSQELVLNLAEIASEAENIANTPVEPADPVGPPPPEPDADSAR